MRSHKRIESQFPSTPFDAQGVRNTLSPPEPINSRIREGKFFSQSARIKRGNKGELVGMDSEGCDNGLRLPEVKGESPLSLPVTLSPVKVDSLVADASFAVSMALSVPDAGIETELHKRYRKVSASASVRKGVATSGVGRFNRQDGTSGEGFVRSTHRPLFAAPFVPIPLSVVNAVEVIRPKSKEQLEAEAIALGERVASFSRYTGIETTIERHERLVREARKSEKREARRLARREGRRLASLTRSLALLD